MFCYPFRSISVIFYKLSRVLRICPDIDYIRTSGLWALAGLNRQTCNTVKDHKKWEESELRVLLAWMASASYIPQYRSTDSPKVFPFIFVGSENYPSNVS